LPRRCNPGWGKIQKGHIRFEGNDVKKENLQLSEGNKRQLGRRSLKKQKGATAND